MRVNVGTVLAPPFVQPIIAPVLLCEDRLLLRLELLENIFPARQNHTGSTVAGALAALRRGT